MKSRLHNLVLVPALLALCILQSALTTARAQVTAFTYQGNLSDNGQPANNTYDLTFTLWNASSTSSGQTVGVTFTNLNTPVTNGLFAVTLDFSASPPNPPGTPNPFTGAPLWLQIGVRASSAAPGGLFTEVSPLQPIQSSPYAIFATTAGAVSASQLTSAGNGNPGSFPHSMSMDNFFVGPAGNATMGGSYNTALGDFALAANTFGQGNTAIGTHALEQNTTGIRNTADGYYSLNANTTGSENTGLGMGALEDCTNGNNNIAIGYEAGVNFNGNESSNIDIGHFGVQGENNTIRIGSSQTATYIAGVIYGNGAGLTNVGTLTLPPTIITNGESGVTLSGAFTGNGSQLTNLTVSAAQLISIGNTNAGAYGNVFLGPAAGNATTSGFYNTAIGANALADITSGSVNTAYGAYALANNTTGFENAAIGHGALFNNTDGVYNTANGAFALYSNIVSGNTATGNHAMQNNVYGQNNTANGIDALYTDFTGNYNTADGADALQGNISGSYNTALGYLAGSLITTGSSNIDIGNTGSASDANIIRIGSSQTTAYIAGVITGNGAGLTNISASQLPAGLVTNGETNLTLTGTFTGNGGGLTNLGASSGSENTAIGNGALTANTSGSGNTAYGSYALYSTTTGSDNTAVGDSALPRNASGWYNTAIGNAALLHNTSGNNNTADGFGALEDNTSGNNNTAFGRDALCNLGGLVPATPSGSNNIALGYQAGFSFSGNESSNIVIGNMGSPGDQNIIRIGSSQTASYIAGIYGVNPSATPLPVVINANGQLGTGTVGNAQLANSSITITAGTGLSGGGTVALGGTITLNANGIDVGSNPTFNGTVSANAFSGDGNQLTDLNAQQLTSVGNGGGNFFVGPHTGNSATTGSDNTAVGDGALVFNTSGWYNTAIGDSALLNNNSGNGNTAIGFGALSQMGYLDLTPLPSGTNNIALGIWSGFRYMGNESSNIVIGNVGSINDQNIIRIGDSQTAAYIAGVITGDGGGLTNLGASSGSENTAIGNSALTATTTGSFNTAVGGLALLNNTSGSYNTAIGDSALIENTSGNGNTADGFNALGFNTSGNNNTAVGRDALSNLGGSSVPATPSGSNNIALGNQAGFNFWGNESSNIVIGNLGSPGDQNIIRIGSNQTAAYIAGINGATVTGAPVVIDPTTGQLGVTTSSVRFKDDIRSMDDASDELLSLRPVTFHYKAGLDPKARPQFGLVAEEVDKIDPDLVLRDSHNQIFTVRYEAVNAMLLNEFLKQHKKVETQSREIETLKDKAGKVDALEKQNDALTARLNDLEAAVKALAERK
ncbi:MAG: tail fiber domain-containing protein [Verrucomicrobiota bacterium]